MRMLQPGTIRLLGTSSVAAGLAMYVSAVHLTPNAGNVEMYSEWSVLGLAVAAIGSVCIWISDYMMIKIRKQANIAELFQKPVVKDSVITKNAKRAK